MIQKNHISITYHLKFESAFHCGTGLTNGLIDRAVQKDKDGYLYISGSTIKGVLRESCEHVAKIFGIPVREPLSEKNAMNTFFESPDIAERIFGSLYQETSIFFDNAWMLNKEDFDSSPAEKDKRKYLFMQTENRTQTRLSRRTGTVMEGALYTSEFGISELEFKGKIHGWLEGTSNPFSDDLPGSYPLFLLIAGITVTSRIGANRSTGMGRCRFDIQKLEVDNECVENPNRYCEEMEGFSAYGDAREDMQ
ncbi:MAG: hypothetical protein GY795_36090 [Desulfobacterales bacterium]|nr:hypothetical protein [Desulfobacterales bacterium]